MVSLCTTILKLCEIFLNVTAIVLSKRILNVKIMYARGFKMAPGISRHRRDPNIAFRV